jgi:hypothetical protein
MKQYSYVGMRPTRQKKKKEKNRTTHKQNDKKKAEMK